MFDKEFRWLDQNRWVGDAVLAAAVAFVSLIGDRGSWYLGRELWLAWTAVQIAPLLLRRTAPKAAVGLGVATLVLNLLVLGYPNVPVVLAPILVHTAAVHLDKEWRIGALVAGLIGSVLAPLRWWYPITDGSIIAMGVGLCAISVVAAFVIGDRQRTRRERLHVDLQHDQERAGFLRTQDEQRTQVTLAAERARIARELHDIVAHSLSVVIVQAQGARAVVDTKPELAGPVLDTIAETSRAALAEMRTLVGVLRGDETDETAADYTPAQGIVDLPDLVDTIRASGVLVDVELRDEHGTTLTAPEGSVDPAQLPPLPPGLELTVYRLVQESLTNVLKHGGPGVRANVELQFWDGLIQLDILDDGRGAASEPSPDGHGLIGMQERVAAMGGQFTAGPRSGGGFAVRARLPLPPLPPRPAGPA